jgi:glyoxylase-like metal-dependent hydrolase (beta-lactamase superfamily II)
MIRYRLLPRILTLCVLFPLSFAAMAQQAPSRSITEIADGLYRATNNNHRTVFLVTADGIILADPINADFSAWLRGQLDARFGVPVRYVVYSHHHWDHASGGAVFNDTAQFVAHENFPANLELPPADTPLPANAAALDANGNGQIEPSEATGNFANNLRLYDMDADGMISGAEATRGALNDVRAPDIVFKDRMTITLGGKSVDLVHVGEMGHTNDMSAVYFPEEKGIFFVDFVSLGRVPFGTIATWGLDALLNSIRVLEMLDYDVAVGGHGVVGNKSDVAAHRHYLEELREAVAAGIAAGQSVEEMQASITMSAYQSWINYENWRPLNVLGMYNLLMAD